MVQTTVKKRVAPTREFGQIRTIDGKRHRPVNHGFVRDTSSLEFLLCVRHELVEGIDPLRRASVSLKGQGVNVLVREPEISLGCEGTRCSAGRHGREESQTYHRS